MIRFVETTIVSTILGILALLSVIGAIACLVHLHRIAGDVDPISGAVSDFGAGPHSRWYQAQVSLVGFGAICLTLGLSTVSIDSTSLWWLVVFGASRLLIAWFPVDLQDRSRTRTGRIHNLLAIAAFASIAVAASGLGRVLDETPGWNLADWLEPLGMAVAIIAGALAVTWLVPTLRQSVFGLVERCWYGAMLIWLAVAPIGLITS